MNIIKAAIFNPIAVNLLMLLILIWGFFSMIELPREVFPEFALDKIQITVTYPGSSPSEIEESICNRIENSIAHLEGIDEITSRASEGMGVVTVDVEAGYDPREVKEDIEREVEQITTFPTDAERPDIRQIRRSEHAVFLALYGDVSEESLKKTAEIVKKQLLRETMVSSVEIIGGRQREISIELNEPVLQAFGITREQVAASIAQQNLNLPLGKIYSSQGQLVLRAANLMYYGRELENIVVLQKPDGFTLKLRDIANVVDGFNDTPSISLFDGKPAINLRVQKVGAQDLINLVDSVQNYLDEHKSDHGNLKLDVWLDLSRFVKGRLQLLSKNAAMGLILVFLSLTLFLEMRLAFFVALGIPISFFGTFILMGMYGKTLNMLTMFGMILVLGIIVDDAVVISESIFAYIKKGVSPFKAAYEGTITVTLPVLASVATTVVAFLPLSFVEGRMGIFLSSLPFVVIAALLFSLVESLIILPGHVAWHGQGGTFGFILNIQSRFQSLLERVIRRYVKWVRFILRWRYAVICSFAVLLMLSGGLISSGIVKLEMFPKDDSEYVSANVEFPMGTPLSHTKKWMTHIHKKLLEAEQELTKGKGKVISHFAQWMGGSDPGSGSMFIELMPSEKRTVLSDTLIQEWRSRIGEIPDLVALEINGMGGGPGGAAYELQFTGGNFDSLQKASEKFKETLRDYPFVSEINDDLRPGKIEAVMHLTPLAQALGITHQQIATQLQSSYFGRQVSRVQREEDDLRIYLRQGYDERTTMASLEYLQFTLPSGAKLPLEQLTYFDFQRGYATITHTNRERRIGVSFDIDTRAGGNFQEFMRELEQGPLTDLRRRYPGIVMSWKGQAEDNQKSMQSMIKGFIVALLLIFTILATLFRSYIQPFLIMFAIPFGFVGAIVGHWMLGFPITMMSMFGLIALAGIVVNNSLILVDFINRRVREGRSMIYSAIKAGEERFRAIFLTSVTTFLGVTPMLMEQSLQARFLQPTVISLAFGLVVSTVFTLLLIPSLYVCLYDVMKLLKTFVFGGTVTREELVYKDESHVLED